MPRHGIIIAFAAYFLWGILPLYWAQLRHVPPLEVLCHRIGWCALCLVPVLRYLGKFGELKKVFRDRRLMRLSLVTTVLITFNWGMYIWAVANGYVVQCSLGYFINPLLNVLLGVVFWKERLRPLQKIAIGCGALGCAIMIGVAGEVPWVAFSLAGTFAVYGALRKKMGLNSFVGLGVETFILVPLVIAYLGMQHARGEGAFLGDSAVTTTLLFLAGVITAAPLVLFAEAAHRLPLTTLGVMQYVAPSLQFLLGIFYFHEPFNATKLVAFGIVWVGLIIFSLDTIRSGRRAVVMKPG